MDKPTSKSEIARQLVADLSNEELNKVFKECQELSIPERQRLRYPSGKYHESIYTPPFRVGKKSGRSVLDSKGLELVIFNDKLQAQLYCDYLNS